MSMYSGMSAPEKTGYPNYQGIVAAYHEPVVCRKLGRMATEFAPGWARTTPAGQRDRGGLGECESVQLLGKGSSRRDDQKSKERAELPRRFSMSSRKSRRASVARSSEWSTGLAKTVPTE
jgi:hypothetical protein